MTLIIQPNLILSFLWIHGLCMPLTCVKCVKSSSLKGSKVQGLPLTGHLPMSQKVVQIQNRQFLWNLCQLTLSWSRLITQNIFGLWWPVWPWQQPQILRPVTKWTFLCHDRSENRFCAMKTCAKVSYLTKLQIGTS